MTLCFNDLVADSRRSITGAGSLEVITQDKGHKCRASFDLDRYRINLNTRVLGNVILFGDVVVTTMTLFEGFGFMSAVMKAISNLLRSIWLRFDFDSLKIVQSILVV